MILQPKTLEKLRILINEETEYRSGPKLVSFFNDLGYRDSYGQGFPSRWIYTDEKLAKINGTPQIDQCIKKLFAPVNFIGRYSDLDAYINDFNQYLAFDGWKVLRKEKDIYFTKADKIDFKDKESDLNVDEFLKIEFGEISFEKLGLDGVITDLLEKRFEEIQKCFNAKVPLAVIILTGSTLEGIILGLALNHPSNFNSAKCAPKDKEGKVQRFHNWSLNNLIDVAAEIGILKEDVRRFSHELREFRNYVHPYQQLSSGFNPDEHTAMMCLQVLRAAIFQLGKFRI